MTSKAISRFFRNLEQGQSVLDSQLTSLNAAVDHIKQDVKGTSRVFRSQVVKLSKRLLCVGYMLNSKSNHSGLIVNQNISAALSAEQDQDIRNDINDVRTKLAFIKVNLQH